MRGYLEDLKAGGRPMTDKELADHYKHLYSEVKKQKDELETSYDILQKNNTTLAKQKEEAYEIADDYYKENEKLKKQKDDVVEYIKYQLSNLDFKKEEDMKAKMLGSMILVMLEDKRKLGEIDE